MPVASITRLRIRHWRFLPAFAVHTMKSRKQILGSRGFLAGYLAGGPRRASWTVTVWEDLESMREYRRTGAHLKAMPKLLDWCDEAAVATIPDSGFTPPPPEEAAALLKNNGRISKVNNPAAGHAAGELWPDNAVPRIAVHLRPEGTSPRA